MHRSIRSLVTIAALLTAGPMLGACDWQTTKDVAKNVAVASLDTICNNVSTASLIIEQRIAENRMSAKDASLARQSIAAVVGVCSKRPVTDVASAMRAVAAAWSNVVMIENRSAP